MNVQTSRIQPPKNRERDDLIHKAWMQISSNEITVKQFLENLSEFCCEDLVETGMCALVLIAGFCINEQISKKRFN